MTKRSAGIALALAAVLGRAATGLAGDGSSLPSDQKAHEAEHDQGGKVVVRFEGGDVNRELALALLTLDDLNLLPTEMTERYAVAKAGPWQAIMEKTHLPAAFPPEMQSLLRRLNPQLKSWENLSPSDEVVFVRSDVLVKVPVRRHFSAESQEAQERRDTISKNWKEYVTSEEDDNTRIDLYGFELSVPVESLEVGRKAVISILKGSQGNAFPSYHTDAEPSVGSYYADLAPAKYWNDAAHQQAGSNAQAFMAAYLGLGELPACAEKRCAGQKCPDVMLVDSAVYPHWDVKDAIAGDSEAKEAEEVGDGSIRKADQDVDDAQHGTYMLGIIAARDGNNAGLVGVHPSASLTTYDWDRYRNASEKFADGMVLREDGRPDRLQVYAFATSWDLGESFPDWVDGSDTENSDLRNKHAVARGIMGDTRQRCNGSDALWVVAAGQSKKILNPDLGLGKNIVPTRYTRGPMNLGDCPNVIVVTACQECDPNELELQKKVNYSECSRKLCNNGVHVVAPGADVISTVPWTNGVAADRPRVESRYARGNGTSPATALTAGLVSAMLSCYPSAFKHPWQVKERIQATSTPVFGGSGRDRFSTGIVDASMALRDPGLTQLVNESGETRAVELLHWCVHAVEFLPDPAASARAVGRVPTTSLLRLKRKAANTNQWIIYSRLEPTIEHQGDVIVHGPSRLGMVDGGSPLAKIREVPTSLGGNWDGQGQSPEKVIMLEGVYDLLRAQGLLSNADVPVSPCN